MSQENLSHIVENGNYIVKVKVFTQDPFDLETDNNRGGTYTYYSFYGTCKSMMHYCHPPHSDTVYVFENFASQLENTPKILAVHCSTVLSASDNVMDVEKFMDENVYEIFG